MLRHAVHEAANRPPVFPERRVRQTLEEGLLHADLQTNSNVLDVVVSLSVFYSSCSFFVFCFCCCFFVAFFRGGGWGQGVIKGELPIALYIKVLITISLPTVVHSGRKFLILSAVFFQEQSRRNR